jgi:hypothetical protein
MPFAYRPHKTMSPWTAALLLLVSPVGMVAAGAIYCANFLQ